MELDRRLEFEMLIDVIHTVAGLNNTSHALEKINECVDKAKTLLETDLDTNRPCFAQYLIERLNEQPQQ